MRGRKRVCLLIRNGRGVFHAGSDRLPIWPRVGYTPSSLSTLLFLLFSFPQLVGLSFVKLDSLDPSLRAITLDYFCLQSCTPRSYICVFVNDRPSVRSERAEGSRPERDRTVRPSISVLIAGESDWFRAHARANSNWGIRRGSRNKINPSSQYLFLFLSFWFLFSQSAIPYRNRALVYHAILLRA